MYSKRRLYLFLANSNSVRQEQEGFKPRSDVPAWKFDGPIDWTADPFNDANWCFTLHAWRMTDVYISELIDNPDSAVREVLARKAVDIALSWCRFQASGGQAPALWNDMACGIRAIRLSFFLSEQFSQNLRIAPDERAILTTAAETHLKKLKVDSYISSNNHGIFQLMGLHWLINELKPADREQQLSRCRTKMKQLFATQFDDFGVHHEHSPDYHLFSLQVFERIGALDLIGVDADASRIVQSAREHVKTFTAPDGSFYRVGDTNGKAPLAAETHDANGTTDLSKSGYQIVRKDGSALFFMGSFNSLSHKHSDDLSIILFEQGRERIIDAGKYGYSRGEVRNYYLSDHAHSTLGFRGGPVLPQKTTAYGSCLRPMRTDGSCHTLSGSVRKARSFRWNRTLQYTPGALLRIEDQFSGLLTRWYESRLLLLPDATVSLTGDQAVIAFADGFKMVARMTTPDAVLSVHRGERDPMKGWWSPSYGVSEPTTLLAASVHQAHGSIVWHIELDPAATEADVVPAPPSPPSRIRWLHNLLTRRG